MPQANETGRSAENPVTGRSTCSCNGGQSGNIARNVTGRGAGGHGRCEWFNAADLAGRTPQENEEKLLRDEAAVLSKLLDEVSRRLKES